MQRRSAQDGKVAGASPATRTNFKLLLLVVIVLVLVLDLGERDSEEEEEDKDDFYGMSTGQASRACLLNSALLENGSVVQVHGIPPPSS